MTGATLCSGIGAPETAMPWVDWRWCAEIEPFPSAVLAERHGKPNLGDITAADFIARAQSYGPLDLLVAGTPCQDFSAAGLRQSLAGERGNLTLQFVRICDALKPRGIVWENVPGVLSTRDNAFGCFLAGLVGADSALIPPGGLRWTDAGMVDGPIRRASWRVLDAQYFGLAQRRRRVFVVASPRGGADPSEILFEREGVQRYSTPRREAGQGTTHELAPSLTSSGRGVGRPGESRGQDPVIAMCLNAGGCNRIDGESETFITVPTLTSNGDAHSGYRDENGLVPAAFNGGVSGTLAASGGGMERPAGNCNEPDFCVVAPSMAVRRLTPRECEKLQGFKPDYTAINYRGKPAADGPRYKALGNSMAVPVLAWIGRRVREVCGD